MRYLYVRLKNWFLYDLKLRRKFFLVYCLCTVIPFMALSLYTCTVTGERIGAHTEENVQALLSQTKAFINYRLQSVIETANAVYLDANLYAYLSAPMAHGYNPELIEEKLATLTGERETQNVNLYLLDESKIPENYYRCKPVSSIQNAAWYYQMQEKGSSSLWFYSTVNHCIYYAKSIYSKYDSERLVGYVVVTANQSVVTDLIEDLCYTQGGIGCVADGDGELVLSRGAGPEDLERRLPGLNRDGELQMVSLNGQSYCALTAWLPDYVLSSLPQWRIVMLAPYEELFAFRSLMIRNIIVASLIAIVVLNLIAAKIIGSITTRMDRLSDGMKNVRSDNMAVVGPALGKDEIGVLQENFNYLMIRMDQLFQQSIEAKEAARKSELNVLQSQINPHFLYNTLDLINWTARRVGSAEISEITQMMAKFYRLTLRRGVEIVSLADELKHVSLYVGLQNKRFDNAIRLAVDVPEELSGCAALKLMLQPVVENSVLHGIMEKETLEGEIRITARRNGGWLEICVEDDGVGIMPETVEALNAGKYSGGDNGIGVMNTATRIQNCFGAGAGLRFESEFGACTRVYIASPCVAYREEMRGLTQIRITEGKDNDVSIRNDAMGGRR